MSASYTNCRLLAVRPELEMIRGQEQHTR
jgi:hypothetical protein